MAENDNVEPQAAEESKEGQLSIAELENVAGGGLRGSSTSDDESSANANKPETRGIMRG